MKHGQAGGQVLDGLAALGPFFAVDAHPPGSVSAPPWRPVSELTGLPGPLADRVGSARAALAARGGLLVDEIEERVAASAVHLGIVARLVSPALGAATLGCPLDVRPGGLWWQEVTGGPAPLSVPCPAPPARAGRPVPAPGTGRDSLPEEWDELLLHEAVAPVTAAMARLVPVSGRVLWGNVASAVNAAARQVAAQRPDLAAGAWAAASQLFASPLLRGEPQPPGPSFRRSSCCLFYRLAPGNPRAVCGDCVLATPHALRITATGAER